MAFFGQRRHVLGPSGHAQPGADQVAVEAGLGRGALGYFDLVGSQDADSLVINEGDLVLAAESGSILRAEGDPDINAAASAFAPGSAWTCCRSA